LLRFLVSKHMLDRKRRGRRERNVLRPEFLNLLDAHLIQALVDRAGGGSGGGDLASDDAGGEVGSSAPAPKAASAGGVRRSSADMDDEIPF
jgi:hypothetical protein